MNFDQLTRLFEELFHIFSQESNIADMISYDSCYLNFRDVDAVGSAFIWVCGSGSIFRMQIQGYKIKEKLRV